MDPRRSPLLWSPAIPTSPCCALYCVARLWSCPFVELPTCGKRSNRFSRLSIARLWRAIDKRHEPVASPSAARINPATNIFESAHHLLTGRNSPPILLLQLLATAIHKRPPDRHPASELAQDTPEIEDLFACRSCILEAVEQIAVVSVVSGGMILRRRQRALSDPH